MGVRWQTIIFRGWRRHNADSRSGGNGRSTVLRHGLRCPSDSSRLFVYERGCDALYVRRLPWAATEHLSDSSTSHEAIAIFSCAELCPNACGAGDSAYRIRISVWISVDRLIFWQQRGICRGCIVAWRNWNTCWIHLVSSHIYSLVTCTRGFARRRAWTNRSDEAVDTIDVRQACIQSADDGVRISWPDSSHVAADDSSASTLALGFPSNPRFTLRTVSVVSRGRRRKCFLENALCRAQFVRRIRFIHFDSSILCRRNCSGLLQSADLLRGVRHRFACSIHLET